MKPNIYSEEVGWYPTNSYMEGCYEEDGTDEDDLNDFPFNKRKAMLREKPLPFPVISFKPSTKKIRTGQRGK